MIAGYGVDENDRSGRFQAGTMTVSGVRDRFIDTEFNGEGSNTCSGDSGGPFLVHTGSEWALAGVTSGGDTVDCLSGNSDFARLRNSEAMSHIFDLVPEAGRR